MGTIAEKLNLLRETKEGIKDAIVEMGGEVPEGEPFSGYPDCILNIPPSSELPSGVYTVTVENPASEKGSVTPAVGSYYVSRKMPITVTAAANSGCQFTGWARYAGKATFPTTISTPVYTYTVTTNVRLVAMFADA